MMSHANFSLAKPLTSVRIEVDEGRQVNAEEARSFIRPSGHIAAYMATLKNN
ncbi:hypothetical protein PsAD14_01578 [Pseudovibrio sp. Ad14]|nr:hypothetical protein PsW74_04750 [Pseudovibrio sp. W74]KZL10053.1 hypothetical protein PsAD14_01578 [Pseudovibrio sp. Ad14]